MAKTNRYAAILERIFSNKYKKGLKEVSFKREDIDEVARELHLQPVKNLGDLIYSFRFRTAFPDSITSKASEGYEWIIRLAGKGAYKLVLAKQTFFKPSANFAETKYWIQLRVLLRNMQ